MAIFTNTKLRDSQLGSKRSASTNSPSGQSADNQSANETSSHNRSPRTSVSPSASAITPEPHDSPPPLPTPVTPGLGSRSPTSSTGRDVSPSSYDHSSTPIPFTKSTKRASPPPFSNLLINVSSSEGSSRAAVDHSEGVPTSGGRAVPPSSSAVYLIPSFSSVKYPPVPSDELSSVLISPSMSNVERQRLPLSQRIATVLPLKLPHSLTYKPNSDACPFALPTPVSPPSERRTVRPEPIPIPSASPRERLHFRSQSASPTSCTAGSAKSSARRFPSPVVGDVGGRASYFGSGSASEKSTPPHEAAFNKPREKRSRNVLRKRSITSGGRNRESESAPASDSEKKVNTHRPRIRSIAFPSRRNSGDPKLDISQPLPAIPTTVVDLTPAKEILVAYKESHRDSFSREPLLSNSGMVVEEEEHITSSLTRPLSSGCKGEPNDKGRIEEWNVDEKGGTGLRALKRKLSGKRSGKELGKRRDDVTRSVSESAVEVSERKLNRDTGTNRSVTISNDTQPSASRTSGRSPLQRRRPHHEEDREWQEDAGNRVGKHLRDTETEKDISNSSRLWKLVKRLSSGNLRERANRPSEPLPPVPPLPKDLSQRRDKSPGELYDFHPGETPIPQSAVPETPGGIRRFITSVPPLSIPHSAANSELGAKQTSFHQHRSELSSGASMPPIPLRMNSVHRSVTTGTTIQMRRTATTRSSSPSSETTKFFSRSRSSSSSSYGDVMAPPMPSIPSARAGKPISSPRQHHSSYDDEDEDTVAMEGSPPAKTSTSSTPRTSNETSANIPPFEAQLPVNNFSPYKRRPPPLSLSPDQDSFISRTQKAKSMNPPPIPKRNPRRPGHHSVSVHSLPAQQHSKPNVILIQDSDESEVADDNAVRPQRRRILRKTSLPSIPKPRIRSISDGAIIPEPERHANTAKSTLTFREMTTAQRHLTEQEKNAKWEDLLQRSAEAGGTLHVGSPISGGLGLWSDRSSVTLSVTPSEALDSTD